MDAPRRHLTRPRRFYVETKAVFTHTVPVDAYRGAGRPEATFLLERIVDLAADEIAWTRPSCVAATSFRRRLSPTKRRWHCIRQR